MKFNVGDYVKIKKGLKYGTTHNFVFEMQEYCGKEAKIVKIDKSYYKLDIDNEAWYWNENMLESVKSKKYAVIVEGNTVTVTDDEGNIGVAKCSPEDEFNLSTGISLAIDRLKWKPSSGEIFFTVDFTTEDNILKYIWSGTYDDEAYYKKGLVFKTRKEAIKTAKKMLEVI